MLLIFDLDDTLIPTSKEITPTKLKKALEKMIASGLNIDFDWGLNLLFSMNQKAESSEKLIYDFIKVVNGDKRHLEIGLNALKEHLGQIKVTQNGSLNTFLKELKNEYKLAIVTGGIKELQHEKIDLYGICRDLFEEIVVSEVGKKKSAYVQLMDKFGSFLVVGDRIKNDLSCAKKLGGITIHIRQGRGEIEPTNHPDVDFEIKTIHELTKVLGRV